MLEPKAPEPTTTASAASITGPAPASVAERVEPLDDLALGRRAYQPVLLDAVLEEHELRDRLHTEARRQRRLLVDVHLGDRRLVAAHARDLTEHGRDDPAGTAPRRPEVDHDRALARDHAVERGVREVHDRIAHRVHPLRPCDATMPRMDSTGAGLQEPRELVHVLVEEREHRDRAVAPLLEVLVHQVEIRVAWKEPQLDVLAARIST